MYCAVEFTVVLRTICFTVTFLNLNCLVTCQADATEFSGKYFADRVDYNHVRARPSTRSKSAASSPVNWVKLAQDDLARTLTRTQGLHQSVARNVILFLGDGMGVSTITAARFLKAQQSGRSIHETEMDWESMPFTGLIKTYNTDLIVPDSGGSGSALLGGEKTRNGIISFNQHVPLGNCTAATAGNQLKSLLHHSMDEEKWTGVISTTRITHATPACAYAHSAHRDWEADAVIPAEFRGLCKDIAYQLIHKAENKKLKVVLGGGRLAFLPSNISDPEYPSLNGVRLDGEDLIATWKDLRRNDNLVEGSDYAYIWNKEQFNSVDASKIQHLLGLFEPTHMAFEADRNVAAEPSLTEMVEKTIQILKRSDQGFFLLVEGGRIDHGHHENIAYKALTDAIEFGNAIGRALQMTNNSDTLIVVTADHSHPFSIAGYQSLESDILGFAEQAAPEDMKPMLTLSYANGPGFANHRSLTGDFGNETERRNLTGVDTTYKDFTQDAGVPLEIDTHGGEDVAVYASGPMAHLFIGAHEQHYIAHAISYASCIGHNKELCNAKTSEANILQLRNKSLVLSLSLLIVFLQTCRF